MLNYFAADFQASLLSILEYDIFFFRMYNNHISPYARWSEGVLHELRLMYVLVRLLISAGSHPMALERSKKLNFDVWIWESH